MKRQLKPDCHMLGCGCCLPGGRCCRFADVGVGDDGGLLDK